jgi:hypothetical protein
MLNHSHTDIKPRKFFYQSEIKKVFTSTTTSKIVSISLAYSLTLQLDFYNNANRYNTQNHTFQNYQTK